MNNQTKVSDVLSPREANGVLSLVALNKLWPKKEIRKVWNKGRWQIRFSWRSKENLWGRFGGGWNWALGFMKSGRTILLYLLICSVSITRKKETANE